MPNKTANNLKQYFDQKEVHLNKKHQQRLDKMTQNALKSHLNYQSKSTRKPVFSLYSIFIDRLLKPFPVVILSSLLFATIAINMLFEYQNIQEKPDSIVANYQIPQWVKDADVPLELLENINFYVWLSQQNYAAKQQNKSFLAVARLNQFGSRQ